MGKGVPIIAETWILACYEFSFKFKEEEFVLGEPMKEEVDHSGFNDPIARAALKIEREIGEQIGKGV